MHDAGDLLPTSAPSGRSRCFCGAALTIALIEAISNRFTLIWCEKQMAAAALVGRVPFGEEKCTFCSGGLVRCRSVKAKLRYRKKARLIERKADPNKSDKKISLY